MSLKKISKEQPEKFEFSDENLNLAKKNSFKLSNWKEKKCSYGTTLFLSLIHI